MRGDSTIRARPACQPTDMRLVESAFVKPFAENFIFPAHAHAPRVFLITSGVTAPVAARIQVEPTSREQAATERPREKYRLFVLFRGIFGRRRKGEEGRGVAWMVIRDVDRSRERNGARGIACDTESGRARRIGRRRFPSLGVSLTSGCLIGVETTGVTGTPWPCRRPNARMPIACRIQGDPPSLVRYHGEPGNYSQHATSYDRVRAFATLPASFPRSPRFSAPLSFVVPCRVAPRPFVSIRFHSFGFALDAKRVIARATLRIRGRR